MALGTTRRRGRALAPPADPTEPVAPDALPPGGGRGARLVGAVLLLGGLLAAQGAVAMWRSGRAAGALPAWAGMLGLALLLALLLPLMAAGIHLLRHGGAALEGAADRRDWERLHARFGAAGRLSLTEAVIALGRPRAEVCGLLRDAAGRGEIQGWLDLRAGFFQLAAAAPGRCPRCAAELGEDAASSLCRACGAEILGPLRPKA